MVGLVVVIFVVLFCFDSSGEIGPDLSTQTL